MTELSALRLSLIGAVVPFRTVYPCLLVIVSMFAATNWKNSIVVLGRNR
jgi:hypothetical protein